MPADAVREAVKAEIRAVTGLDPVLRGGTSVSLFPTGAVSFDDVALGDNRTGAPALTDRKSTRLNSSHSQISYAVFCLKKKKRTVSTQLPMQAQTSCIIHQLFHPTPFSAPTDLSAHYYAVSQTTCPIRRYMCMTSLLNV